VEVVPAVSETERR